MRTGVTPKRITTRNLLLFYLLACPIQLTRYTSYSSLEIGSPILSFSCICCRKQAFHQLHALPVQARLKLNNWTVKQPLLKASVFQEDFYLLERRWSSRTFRYGYLVTTSPQSSAPPSAAPSFRLGHWLRAFPTPMVWRAVCTRPGNVFTATCWFAITSDSSFM